MSEAPTNFANQTTVRTLDRELQSRLSRVAGKLRVYLLLQGAARLAAYLVLAALLQFALDYGVRGMRWSMRATLLAVLVFVAIVVVWRRIVAPLMLRLDPADIAKLIERKFPQLSSLLVSAIRFASGEVGPPQTNSPDLMAAVISAAPKAAGPLDFGAILSGRSPRRAVFVIICALGVAATAGLAAPEKTRLWFDRNVLLRNTPWPKHTRLVLDLPNGELVGARGDDLTLTVRHEGRRPDEVEVFYTTLSGQDGRDLLAVVGRDENLQFRHVFKNVREEFVFHLTGGDDTTEEYKVRLLERPRIDSAEMRITPPAYSRLPAFTVGGAQRSAQVLPGSQIAISIQPNKPLVSATLMSGEKRIVQAEQKDGYLATFVADATATYHFALLDEFGLEDKNPARFSIRLLKDDPPQARLRAPGVGEMVTPTAVLPLEIQASDAYGLATVELRYTLTRESTLEELIELTGFKPDMTTYSQSFSWPLSSISAAPGDRFSLRGSAADFDDVSGPKVTESAELTMRVVTADELLAELARREHEFRMDFERLIDAQEQLRGRLLTLMDSAPAAATPDFIAAVSGLERRQRGIAGSINVVRQQFEQVLTEMRINQLTSDIIEQRLGGKIVEPLADLARRDLAVASDAIRTWSKDAAPAAAAQIDAQQVILLTRLREILSHMIQWQGYQEAVTMLRDILRLQEELKNETQGRMKEEGKGVFDK